MFGIDQNNLKLNLGCGDKKINGYLNIDNSKFVDPDYLMDLENVPYPFKSNTVIEIRMKSVLEHLAPSPKKFFSILQEIYRICKHQAKIYIESPYPFHRWQIVDFTHQRPIHVEGLRMLDKEHCQKYIDIGSAKTPLAFMYDIDFRVKKFKYSIDPDAKKHIRNVLGEYDPKKIESYTHLFTNVMATQAITLEVNKPSTRQ